MGQKLASIRLMAANVHPLTENIYGLNVILGQKTCDWVGHKSKKSCFFGKKNGKVKNGHFKNVQNAKSYCLSENIFSKKKSSLSCFGIYIMWL